MRGGARGTGVRGGARGMEVRGGARGAEVRGQGVGVVVSLMAFTPSSSQDKDIVLP